MRLSLQLNRRDFITKGSSLIALPILGTSLASCASLFASEPIPWLDLSKENDHKGQVKIEKIEGTVLVDGVIQTKEKLLKPGQSIEVTSGEVFASLPDDSVVKLSNKAKIDFDLDSKQGGIIQVRKGGILAVVRKAKRNPYLIRNSTALVGVKGTVFYTEVLSEEEKARTDVPKGATDYFCLCNGRIDYLNQQGAIQKSSLGVHHNSYFMKSDGGAIDFDYAGWLFNHTDDEILDLVKIMKPPKHSMRWITSGGY